MVLFGSPPQEIEFKGRVAGSDMRIVAGTAGMPVEPLLPKVRNHI